MINTKDEDAPQRTIGEEITYREERALRKQNKGLKKMFSEFSNNFNRTKQYFDGRKQYLKLIRPSQLDVKMVKKKCDKNTYRRMARISEKKTYNNNKSKRTRRRAAASSSLIHRAT